MNDFAYALIMKPDFTIDGHKYFGLRIGQPEDFYAVAKTNRFACLLYSGKLDVGEIFRGMLAERLVAQHAWGAQYVLCAGAEREEWRRSLSKASERKNHQIVVEAFQEEGSSLTDVARYFHSRVVSSFRRSVILVVSDHAESLDEVLTTYEEAVGQKKAFEV